MKPKKLIREKITSKLKEGEFENITNQEELNALYALKIKEELAEIQDSNHKDIMEFVDLITVAVCFAEQNGFSMEQLELAGNIKYVDKGKFSNLALNNLNPENPSNKLYFPEIPKNKQEKIKSEWGESDYAFYEPDYNGWSTRGVGIDIVDTKLFDIAPSFYEGRVRLIRPVGLRGIENYN